MGSLIGIVAGTICYLVFWPNPFSAKTFVDNTGRPMQIYGDENEISNVNFSPIRIEEDDELEVA